MTAIWCVRADSGQFTRHFLRGGYAGIGWSEIAQDLGRVASREDLYPLVRASYRSQQRATARRPVNGALGRHPIRVPGAPRAAAWTSADMTQFSVVEHRRSHWPTLKLFVNARPLAV